MSNVLLGRGVTRLTALSRAVEQCVFRPSRDSAFNPFEAPSYKPLGVFLCLWRVSDVFSSFPGCGRCSGVSVGWRFSSTSPVAYPDEDNYVLKSAPTAVQTNNGTLTLKVASSSQSKRAWPFLKFRRQQHPVDRRSADLHGHRRRARPRPTSPFACFAPQRRLGRLRLVGRHHHVRHASRPSTSGVLVDTTLATSVGNSVSIPTGQPPAPRHHSAFQDSIASANPMARSR
jgi:hypothetical protein